MYKNIRKHDSWVCIKDHFSSHNTPTLTNQIDVLLNTFIATITVHHGQITASSYLTVSETLAVTSGHIAQLIGIIARS